MKKIILILTIILGTVLTGCNSDKDYIETVKTITFKDGKSVEQILTEDLNNMDLATLLMELYNRGLISEKYLSQGLSDKDLEYLERMKAFDNTELKWEVEGKTKIGRIIRVTSKFTYSRIFTTDNGDFIEMSREDIKYFTLDGTQYRNLGVLYVTRHRDKYNKYIQAKTAIDSIVKYLIPEEYFRSIGINQKDAVKYHPSGRVASIEGVESSYRFDDVDLMPSIVELNKKIYARAGYVGDREEFGNLIFDIETLEAFIIAEKMNKNVTKKQLDIVDTYVKNDVVKTIMLYDNTKEILNR